MPTAQGGAENFWRIGESCRKQCHVDGSFTGTVQFDEEDRLPGAHCQVSVCHGNAERGTQHGGSHMRPGMRGVVLMAKTDRGNDPLDDVEKILLGAFPDFAGREGRRGMSDEKRAQTFAHFRVSDQRLNSLREVDDLFQMFGGNPQDLRHARLHIDLYRPIIDNVRQEGKSGLISDRCAGTPLGGRLLARL
jgi:hypothetical protein